VPTLRRRLNASGVARGLVADLTRTRHQLLAENALLRQQLLVAARRIKRARFRATDRALLVALAATFTHWRDALVLVQPETLVRWHRQGFKLLWTWRSRKPKKPRVLLAKDVIDLIRRMATSNRLWGAERIRGELLKLGHTAAKSTIQRYLARFRGLAPDGQHWSTFPRNQAHAIWCCDLLEVRDLFFRCHYVLVVMHLETRRMLCAVSTRTPTANWLTGQLRQLTPFVDGPKFVIRDNDQKFGEAFDAVASGAGAKIIRTPLMSPKANAHVERMIGSVRRNASITSWCTTSCTCSGSSTSTGATSMERGRTRESHSDDRTRSHKTRVRRRRSRRPTSSRDLCSMAYTMIIALPRDPDESIGHHTR
jgi:hypothetical protein